MRAAVRPGAAPPARSARRPHPAIPPVTSSQFIPTGEGEIRMFHPAPGTWRRMIPGEGRASLRSRRGGVGRPQRLRSGPRPQRCLAGLAALVPTHPPCMLTARSCALGCLARRRAPWLQPAGAADGLSNDQARRRAVLAAWHGGWVGWGVIGWPPPQQGRGLYPCGRPHAVPGAGTGTPDLPSCPRTPTAAAAPLLHSRGGCWWAAGSPGSGALLQGAHPRRHPALTACTSDGVPCHQPTPSPPQPPPLNLAEH